MTGYLPDARPRWAAVPGGVLRMRDARTGTSRQVQLAPFRLSVTPVTRQQYRAVAAAGRPENKPDDVPVHGITWLTAVAWCNAASKAANLTPAYRRDGDAVTWDVAADGYRLPTEAEWEWACRAHTTGPTYGALGDIGWTAADQVSGPQPVAGKRPNGFGLFDMIGNVWEWCWDYADTARYFDYRTLRGGGWADPDWSCRASVRRGSAPNALLEDVGFRVACGPVGEVGDTAAQGWSAESDRRRADIRGPLPTGWTPLRSLLAPKGDIT